MTAARPWLSERRRSGASLAFAVVVGVLLVLLVGTDEREVSLADLVVLVLLAYLFAYLLATAGAFSRASPAEIHEWARRDSRGTVLQRYVLGTAPGPGVSIFFAAVALAVAMVWLPGIAGVSLPQPARVGVAVALAVVAWVCVLVSFAVAYHADDLVEDGAALQFPGSTAPGWSDYVYFSMACMTTFGTTDVSVASPQMRRTVTTNAVIAFVFNTVTVAAVVSALTG